MALFENSLLRDLFQNNIDFVAKQISRVLDSLYGEQATESDTIDSMPFMFHTTMYKGDYGSNILNGMRAEVQNGVYSITFDEDGVHCIGIDNCPANLSTYESAQTNQAVIDSVMPYLKSYEFELLFSQSNVKKFRSIGNYLYAVGADNSNIENIGYTKPFGIDTNRNFTLSQFNLTTDKQSLSTITQWGEPYQYNVFPQGTLWSTGSTEFFLYSIGDTTNPSSVVCVPSSDSRETYYLINNYQTNTYNTTNGDTVYNYYNDNGDLIINGGGVGIAPVVGLGYADFKLILDSLVDDLNLQFNFGTDGTSEALQYAPTWEELHYIDQGSFYITPIKQIPQLPLAPDLADTVIDISEPIGILTDGFNGVLGAFDTLGITLMVSFTFLARLCIRKIRGE